MTTILHIKRNLVRTGLDINTLYSFWWHHIDSYALKNCQIFNSYLENNLFPVLKMSLHMTFVMFGAKHILGITARRTTFKCIFFQKYILNNFVN